MPVFADHKPTLPAWLMSLILHTCLLLALALGVSSRGRHLPDESPRSVAIVLADNSAVDHDYITPATDLANKPPSKVPGAAFPAAEFASSLVSPDLSLPQRDHAIQPPGERVFAVPGMITGAPARVPTNHDPSAVTAEQAALRAAREALGPSANLRIFGGPAAEGRSFVFLIDRSKSMGSQGLGALQAAERELIVALQTLGPTHRFQIVAYHHQCVHLNRRELLPATEENRRQVVGFLSGLAAFGATEHERALTSALALKPDVVFLLTDGGDPPLGDAQIRRIVRLAGSRTTIHGVHFGYGPLQEPDHFLGRLAALSRGGYRYVDMSIHER